MIEHRENIIYQKKDNRREDKRFMIIKEGLLD